jgi:ribosomal-protein-alanine N-acetyltransferase
MELRPWRLSDAESLARHANDPDVSANLTDAFPYPYALSDAESYIRDCIAKEETQLCRAIVIGGEAVGSVGAFPQTDIRRRTAVLGDWLAKPFWGRGIMTAAVGMICREAWARFDILRIEAQINARNIGSRRVAEKNGFTLEGILRQSACKRGEILDTCMYALLREEVKL